MRPNDLVRFFLLSIQQIRGGTIVAMQAEPQKLPGISQNLFIILLFLIVGGAFVRSALATRLDGFTIDEAYHITASVSYV